MIIKNKSELVTSALKNNALEIIEAGIAAADPYELVKSVVRYDSQLNSLIVQNKTYNILSGRIFVIGGGKAAGRASEALEEIIGADNITAGIVNVKNYEYHTRKIKIVKAGHPLPDKKGLSGVKKMLNLKEKYNIGAKDLVICLVSGGASAMMPAPVDGVSLQDYQLTTELLIKSGANISEINTVRKHLSKVQGGRLARHFAPARVVSLVVSDVIDNDLGVIGSGPTVMDPTIFRDAYYILEKYFLFNKIPKSASLYIERGCHDMEEENPKALKKCTNHLLGDIKTSLEAMSVRAKSLGLNPIILSSELSGDPVVAVKGIKQALLNGFSGYNAIILGGETTPKLPVGHGRGGRNQHFASLVAFDMKNSINNWTMASVGTDGSDYLNDVAGAIVDNSTYQHAVSLGVDIRKYINNYNSNEFFEKINNSLIITGDTGTNVGDIVVYVFG